MAGDPDAVIQATPRDGKSLLEVARIFRNLGKDEAAAKAARERGHEGKWVFTLHKPSLIPFLQYSERRDLRERMFKAYIQRGNNNNEFDNKAVVAQMAVLRAKRAKLLGYETHAHYTLEDRLSRSNHHPQINLF